MVDPKGGILGQVGSFLEKQGYKIKVFSSIDFARSMHYNPISYIKTEADILKFVNALIENSKGEGKEGDPFWTKSETLLYCALIAYIVFEGPEEDRNINTLVDIISGMEVKEDDEDFKGAVDYMFEGLAKRKPDCFAVKQYRKFKLASGKTAKSILISCGARLAPFDMWGVRSLLTGCPMCPAHSVIAFTPYPGRRIFIPAWTLPCPPERRYRPGAKGLYCRRDRLAITALR